MQSKFRLVPVFASAAALALAACQDPTGAAAGGLEPGPASRELAPTPTDVPSLSALFVSTSDVSDLDVGSLRAIDPKDYVCPSSTPVSDWFTTLARQTVLAERATYVLLYNYAGFDVPTYQALFFETPATPQTYGYAGQFTDVMLKTEKDIKRFWDIPSASIQTVAMHGTVLLDTAKVAATYRFAYGVNATDAAAYAALVRNAVVTSTTLNGGDHPLFTFNAFAYRGSPALGIAPKIVMGDGILEGFAAVGLGDVAPQGIYAHEFAHQIQYARNYFADPIATTGTAPERTRYTELMADAFAAYYLTHARGAAMQRKRVEQFLQVFFQIGDCGFTSSGHHGTPNQRMAAARFGFVVAAEAQKQGQILTAAQFHARFLTVYPTLVAPDAP